MPKRNGIGRFVVERRSTIVEVISALFILLFLYTAISKSLDINRTVAVVQRNPLLLNHAESVSWAVVIIEYIVSILLFLPKTRKSGLYISLSLMLIFIGYILYMMTFVPNLPCSCGGVISKMSWKQHLFFNIFFAGLAFSGIRLSRKRDI